MSQVVSLIAAREKSPLSAKDAEAVRAALESSGAECGRLDWLSSDEACDIPFGGDRDNAVALARRALADSPVDVNVVPLEFRRKKLLVADMDSTLIQQECIDELAAEIGVGERVAAITERAMQGEIAFEPALRERVALLHGVPVAVADRVLAQRIAIMPGAAVLVATMRAAGAFTALVSGGFTTFAGPIAGRLGFDDYRANTLLADGIAFTGHVAEPILGRAAKKDTLLELTTRLGLCPEQTLAVGDGANDIEMVRIAGLGVAFRAKQALRAEAGAVIDHADLSALLFLQGYRRDEFAAGS
jgi:phosphoserine phosphatase